MQKNWYVVYTRTQCEKKVAALLTKKKIENFIPQVCLEAQNSRRNKVTLKPLFKSYVFVHATEQEAALLPLSEGIINLLYWLGKPAVITDAEVEAVRKFTSDYQNIDVQKLSVSNSVMERSIFRSSYEIDGNVLAVKNRTIKINLPSLGYALIANFKEDSIFVRESSMLQNYTFAQS